MEPINEINALAAVLDRPNVDTDQIIPKQFLRSVKRTGFGPFLFDEWRYLDRGELGMNCDNRPKNPEFSLNHPRYANAEILLARDNFGCGSSREHAVWALTDYGFRAVVAPSFSDIFYSNSIKNGFLPVCLAADNINALFDFSKNNDLHLQINLAAQTVVAANQTYSFDIAEDEKIRLLNGLDDIALTLQHAAQIRDYEKQRRQTEPWIFEKKA